MNTNRRRAVAALDRRRAAVGHHRAAVQAGPAVAAAGLAHSCASAWPPRSCSPAARAPAAGRAAGPPVLASGAVGYGGSVVLQNAGITRTSVTHAALLIGAVPVLVAVIAAVWQRAVARPVAWAGFAVSLAGVGLVAGGQRRRRDAPPATAWCWRRCWCRPRSRWRRRGCCGPGPGRRDRRAVPRRGPGRAAVRGWSPRAARPSPPAPGPSWPPPALAAGGTLLPFTLFAYGQSRVPAEVAGAFLNIEPLVGAVAGVVVLRRPGRPGAARRGRGHPRRASR